MAIVPRVTIEDYKDWHRRYELKCPLPPDDKLQEGLDRANQRAQEIEDHKQARRLCQGTKEPNPILSDAKHCRVVTPDNIPVYPIKYPAPEKGGDNKNA